jgi:XTP/dITP diphosphohydrolase
MDLIFATHNRHKVEEIRSVLNPAIRIISLDESGIHEEIEEPFDTLEENATAKSKFIYERTGLNCFSEDTGLEVDALGGKPGVHSARYAGEERSFERNMELLLRELEGQSNRRARFRTVISLFFEGEERLFEGICNGHIAMEKRGSFGFGYDPVFIPSGEERTFGEMKLEEKSRFSHRAKAVEKLVTFLNNMLTNS